jgi:hypothetical protein
MNEVALDEIVDTLRAARAHAHDEAWKASLRLDLAEVDRWKEVARYWEGLLAHYGGLDKQG